MGNSYDILTFSSTSKQNHLNYYQLQAKKIEEFKFSFSSSLAQREKKEAVLKKLTSSCATQKP
jgi:hypothetical protein